MYNRRFSAKKFRRDTSKCVKKFFEKLLTFLSKCGILLVSKGEGQNPLAHWSGQGRQTAEPSQQYRATAEEYSRWGVAVGILITEDCGEGGNP